MAEVKERSHPENRNIITVPGIVVLFGTFLIRSVYTIYMVIGLYAKLKNSILQQSSIKVLDSLYIGHLPLGTTLNVLILSLVSLFPIYLVVGMLGIMAALCRNKSLLIVSAVCQFFNIALDIVYIVMFSIIYNGINESLGNDLQNLYNIMHDIGFNDAFGYGDAWKSMFTNLACCSVTVSHNAVKSTSNICSSEFSLTCWTEISASLKTYCATFISLPTVSLITEIMLICMSDYIFGDIYNRRKEKLEFQEFSVKPESKFRLIMLNTKKYFPMAMGKTAVSLAKKTWKQSPCSCIGYILNIIAIALSFPMIGFGVKLQLDEKMTGKYINYAYSHMLFHGRTYNSILEGMVGGMIFLGCITIITHSVVLLDIKWRHKLKSRIVLIVLVLLAITKIVCVILWAVVDINIRGTLENKFSNLLREYNTLYTNLNVVFVMFSCCGANYVTDLGSLTETANNPLPQNAYYPKSCCQGLTDKAVEYNTIYTSNVDVNCKPAVSHVSPTEPCLEKLKDRLMPYSNALYVTLVLTSFFEVILSLIILYESRKQGMQYSPPAQTEEENADKADVEPPKKRYTLFIPLIIAIICYFGVLVTGLCLRYDKIFTHYIILLLWNKLQFSGIPFNNLLSAWNGVIISFGVFGLVKTCVFALGVKVFKLKSSCLNMLSVLGILFMGISSLIAVLWLSVTVKNVNSSMASVMYTKLTQYSEAYTSSRYKSNINGAWNNLFSLGECCGVYNTNGDDFPTFSVSWNTQSQDQIPIYCCQTNPVSDNWDGDNAGCTDELYSQSRFTTTCANRVNTKINGYMIAFVTLMLLAIACEVIQFGLLVRVITNNLNTLEEDRFLKKFKGLFKMQRKITIPSKTWIVVRGITLFFGAVSMVLGIVMMYEKKLTDDYVNALYQQLYFHGFRLSQLIQRLYIVTIMFGLLTMVAAIFGLSDLLTRLAGPRKEICYRIMLVLLILAKICLLFAWIPFHRSIAWSSRFQMDNVFRQWGQSGHRIWNRYHIAMSCCGVTYSYNLQDLARKAYDFGSKLTHEYPRSCCKYESDYSIDSNIWQTCQNGFQENFCHDEYMKIMNGYSAGYYVIFSLMIISEISCFIFSAKTKTKQESESSKTESTDSSNKQQELESSKTESGDSTNDENIDMETKFIRFSYLALCITLLLCCVGLFLEGLVFHFDPIFAHPVISVLWKSVHLWLFGRNYSFSETNTMLVSFTIANSIIIMVTSVIGILSNKSKSKLLHFTLMVMLGIVSALKISEIGVWGKTKTSVESTLRDAMQEKLDSISLEAEGFTIHGEDIHAAWNYLFTQLECCGVTNGTDADFKNTINVRHDSVLFGITTNPSIPVYCCKNNPLTEVYTNAGTCSPSLSSDRRFDMPCSNTILERFRDYSIGVFIISALMVILQVIQFGLLLLIVSHSTTRLKEDVYLKKVKGLFKMQRAISIPSKTWIVVRGITLFFGAVSMVLGIVMMHENKLTNDYVNALYQQLYFYGFQLSVLIQRFYSVTITCGVLTMATAIFGLSDLSKRLAGPRKNTCYRVMLALLILTKIGLLIAWIPFHRSMAWNSRFQMDNIFRQWSQSGLRIWNRYHIAMSCCGVTYSYNLQDLARKAYDFGSKQPNEYPRSCCKYESDYSIDSNIWQTCQNGFQENFCHDEFIKLMDGYSAGFYVIFCLMIMAEVACFIFSAKTKTQQNPESSQKASSDNSNETNIDMKTKIIRYSYLASSITILLCGLGLFFEGLLLHFDPIFTHPVIKVLWNSVYLWLFGRNYSFSETTTMLSSFTITNSVIVMTTSVAGILSIKSKSKFIHLTFMGMLVIASVLKISEIGVWGKTRTSVDGNLRDVLQTKLDSISLEAEGYTIHGQSISAAWNYLFAQLKCCGVTNGTDFKNTIIVRHESAIFGITTNPSIPVYCCKNNPLTEVNMNAGTCTPSVSSDGRYDMPCNFKILERFYDYGIGVFTLSALIVVLQIIQFGLLLRVIIKNPNTLSEDMYWKKFKGFVKRKITIPSKIWIVVRGITMILGAASMVLGIVMMHENKLTSDYVNALYQQLYFHGFRLSQLIQRLYSVTITCGVLTMAAAIFGLSDLSKRLAGPRKTTCYRVMLVLLILTKIGLLFAWIPFHRSIAWSSRFQMDNVFRQWGQSGHRIWNRYHIAMSCCGVTYSYNLQNLARKVYNFGSKQPNEYPRSCCKYESDYSIDSNIWQTCNNGFQENFCHDEYMKLMNGYSAGFYAIFSLMIISEITCFILPVKTKTQQDPNSSEAASTDSSHKINIDKKTKIIRFSYFALCMTLVLCGVGLFCEGLLLHLDTIFAHPVISVLWKSVHLRLFSRNYSFSDTNTMLSLLTIATSIVVMVTSMVGILGFKSKSKDFHFTFLVMLATASALIVSQIGVWGKTKSYVDSNLRGLLQSTLDSISLEAEGYTIHGGGISAAWNHLFTQLECCGVTYGNDADFKNTINVKHSSVLYGITTNPSIPVYCCKNNPLTEVYTDAGDCSPSLSSDRRFDTPCSNRILERFHSYSIGVFTLSALIFVLQVVLLILKAILTKQTKSVGGDIDLGMKSNPSINRVETAEEEETVTAFNGVPPTGE